MKVSEMSRIDATAILTIKTECHEQTVSLKVNNQVIALIGFAYLLGQNLI